MKTSSMSDNLFPAGAKQTVFDFLKEKRFPEAVWDIGGVFRFDQSILKMNELLNQVMSSYIPLKEASGSPACLWTLDWFKPRTLTRLSDFRETLEKYAVHGMGVSLYLDNPFITDSQLTDAVGNTFLSELFERDRLRLNSVTVATDKLRDHIGRNFPKLKVRAGVNRLVAEAGKRTAALYEKMAESYDRVAIHPADNVKWDMLAGLKDKNRFEITINDTCLRTCPVRRDHMKTLAQIRENPYSAELLQRRHKILQSADCEVIERAGPQQKRTLLLTRTEWDRLYDMGFRNFRVQAESLRNEIAFVWEMCRALFGYDVDISEKIGLIYSSFIMGIVPSVDGVIPSGLTNFFSSSYE